MSLKEILEIAKAELSDLTDLSKPDFRLEQAEYKNDQGIWDVVVSYLVENTNKRSASPLAALASDYQYHRIYKRLKIDNDKAVVGFYIYNNKE
jgi:hypothetical protein